VTPLSSGGVHVPLSSTSVFENNTSHKLLFPTYQGVTVKACVDHDDTGSWDPQQSETWYSLYQDSLLHWMIFLNLPLHEANTEQRFASGWEISELYYRRSIFLDQQPLQGQQEANLQLRCGRISTSQPYSSLRLRQRYPDPHPRYRVAPAACTL
jgi:hypothetical protein